MRAGSAREVEAGQRLGGNDQPPPIVDHSEPANEPRSELAVSVAREPHLVGAGNLRAERDVPGRAGHDDLVTPRERTFFHAAEYRARACEPPYQDSNLKKP